MVFDLGSRIDSSDVVAEAGVAGLVEIGGVLAPRAPFDLADTDVSGEILSHLILKIAYTVPHFTTEWVVKQVCLPLPIVADLIEQLRHDHMVEVLGSDGPFSDRLAITDLGRQRAQRLMEISGYVGPAPVSLRSYQAMLEWQLERLPVAAPKEVAQALEGLELTDHARQVAGLASQSRRSLFVYGPPGNGKTTLGHLIHEAIQGDLWIPACISVEQSIIQLYDPNCHENIAGQWSREDAKRIDHRWLKIRRPFVVVGGELTLSALELTHIASRNYYEAPLHMKANGGTFLLDDLGRQQVDSQALLSRWIVPLESQIDYLTLETGQKIHIPFQQMLIVSTNLDPDRVMDPAFLRRMGYRLYLGEPSADAYRRIFTCYAQRVGMSVDEALVSELLARYDREGRRRLSCHPRDLLERVRDISRFRGNSPTVTREVLELAWTGYFGNEPTDN
ncbi:MAG: hypothetical protein OER86_10010 [Phycisphaerae bacterium]|nr:hypothetical protein [Phycisphaerae bacterium]